VEDSTDTHPREYWESARPGPGYGPGYGWPREREASPPLDFRWATNPATRFNPGPPRPRSLAAPDQSFHGARSQSRLRSKRLLPCRRPCWDHPAERLPALLPPPPPTRNKHAQRPTTPPPQRPCSARPRSSSYRDMLPATRRRRQAGPPTGRPPAAARLAPGGATGRAGRHYVPNMHRHAQRTPTRRPARTRHSPLTMLFLLCRHRSAGPHTGRPLSLFARLFFLSLSLCRSHHVFCFATNFVCLCQCKREAHPVVSCK